jgi:hypothetical protein
MGESIFYVKIWEDVYGRPSNGHDRKIVYLLVSTVPDKDDGHNNQTNSELVPQLN